MRKAHLLAAPVIAAACFPVVASAQTILFQENFDSPGAGSRFTQHTSTNNGETPDFMVDFHYDYGAFEYLRYPQGIANPPTFQFIPPAPGGTSARGLRISVNDSAPAAAMAFQLIPNGVQPGTDFRMEFHMWMNYNGGALGGTGSTQAMVAGLNTDPSAAGIIGPSPTAFNPQAVAGYAMTANGEGGSINDYRMYDRGEPAGFDDGPNFPKVNGTWAGSDELRFDRTTGELVLAAGTVVLDRPSNHTNSYYDTVFPGDDIGGGSFETRGAPGKAWVPVVIEQRGNEVSFSMNGFLISTLFRATAATGVPEFGYTDEFNSVASPAIDNFILYDNLIITQLAAAPRFTATSGNYSNAANWSGGTPPNGANEKADFGGAPGASTVTVDTPVTLRSIVFSGPDYTVNGPSTITMSAQGNSLISNAGNHVINAAVNSQGHLSAFVQENSTLRVNNLTHDQTKGFMKAGIGTFEVNRVRSSHITQTGGTLKLLPGGISRTGRLDILNSTSKLDITTAGLIIDWTLREAPGDPNINTNPREAVIAEILAGFNGGTWDGFGIYSSTAAANSNYAVGYADTSQINITSFGGEGVDTTTMLVRGTRRGDANVDGVVNLSDFNLLAANFGGTDKDWWNGDFNYDGTVNLTDFNALAANFGQSASGTAVTPQDWSNLANAVPEPSGTALLGAGAVALARRRRRD